MTKNKVEIQLFNKDGTLNEKVFILDKETKMTTKEQQIKILNAYFRIIKNYAVHNNIKNYIDSTIEELNKFKGMF